MPLPLFISFRSLQFCALLWLSAACAIGQGLLDISDTKESPLERAKRAREELVLRMQEEVQHETLEARIERLKGELAKAQAELVERREADLKSAEVEVSTGALAIVVAGGESKGTGFIAVMRGRTFFITNIHVLGAARDASIQTLNGVDIELPDYGFVSRLRDVAIVPIEWDGPTLALSQSLSFDEADVGDALSLVGYLESAGVTRLEGTLRGVNADELEVSTRAVPRNSGSPIIHKKSGKVVAIVSHYQDVTPPLAVDPDRERVAGLGRIWTRPVVPSVRCFGARLDGDVEWSRVFLVDLYEQADTYHRYRDRTQAMSRIGHQLVAEEQVLDQYSNHESLGYLFDHFESDFTWSHLSNMSSHDQRQLKRFIAGMLSELQTDRQSTQEALQVEFYQRRYESMEAKRNQAVQDFIRYRDTWLD